MDTTGYERPKVRLVGENRNAFAIIGRTQRAMRRAGWTSTMVGAFRQEATSGNYEHLLATVAKYCDVDGVGASVEDVG